MRNGNGCRETLNFSASVKTKRIPLYIQLIKIAGLFKWKASRCRRGKVHFGVGPKKKIEIYHFCFVTHDAKDEISATDSDTQPAYSTNVEQWTSRAHAQTINLSIILCVFRCLNLMRCSVRVKTKEIQNWLITLTNHALISRAASVSHCELGSLSLSISPKRK